MRSIRARVNKIIKRNPNLGKCLCFEIAVREQKFSKQAIRRNFYKLVPKDDYDKKDKKSLLAHLEEVSNMYEDDKF